jgi:hypothetical protein
LLAWRNNLTIDLTNLETAAKVAVLLLSCVLIYVVFFISAQK